MIEAFFALAREPVDGFVPPDADEDVVRIETDSLSGFRSINLKRQMTRLDADGDVAATTYFYVDMSFRRQAGDRELACSRSTTAKDRSRIATLTSPQ